ncbi:MAG: ribonuclease HII [Parcubacteria group bacterium]|jgi:ribonuclease HII
MKNKVKLESTLNPSVAIDRFELEKDLFGKGWDFVVGVDEAGRGPLAGPVVAAAVVVRNSKFQISNFKSNSNDKKIGNTPSVLRTSPPRRGGEERMWDLIRDSKKLSEKRREEVFGFIMENFYVGVGICNHETVDRINVLEATFLAMKKAIGDLKSQIKEQKKIIILVDGDKMIPNFSLEQKAIISGDKLVKSISAASIIAKVTRDRIMNKFDKEYPAYQFAKHKGYGTKIHIEALKQNGPCKIHRKTFAPVRNAINDRWKA